MVKEQVFKLIFPGKPVSAGEPELIETHISWVLLNGSYAYKIKKPVHYSFLDFSTLEKRKFYCQREIELNKRFSNIYLEVLPIRELRGRLFVGGEKGEVIDYTVCMKRLDHNRQMNVLLLNNEVGNTDIISIAEKVALFHKQAAIVRNKNLWDVAEKFRDLGDEGSFLEEAFEGVLTVDRISHAIDLSDKFAGKNMELLESRLLEGLFRDCHGDLHSRNIFLVPYPELFDCLEFNDDYRYIDVLNELAFLCMDLDSYGRQALSNLFIRHYNNLFPVMRTASEEMLFVYYKAYRANIRAKVNSLRARDTENESERVKALSEVKKYLMLMEAYINILDKA